MSQDKEACIRLKDISDRLAPVIARLLDIEVRLAAAKKADERPTTMSLRRFTSSLLEREAVKMAGTNERMRFSVIAGALDIPGQVIIDGEVVVIHDGRTNFSELQADLAVGEQDRLVYYAFDLLWRDGDLRKLPRWSASRRCQTCSGKMASNFQSFIPNT